jgi:hypothetical protein
LPALLLMLINLRQFEYLVAKLAGDSETQDDLFNYSAGTSDPYIFMAARTVFVKLQPIFYAALAK